MEKINLDEAMGAFQTMVGLELTRVVIIPDDPDGPSLHFEFGGQVRVAFPLASMDKVRFLARCDAGSETIQ